MHPNGEKFFARSVHGVHAAAGEPDVALPRDAAGQLRQWGFNALGVTHDATMHDEGLPFLASVEFCDAAPPITAPGLRLPDVFDPEWPKRAAAHAKSVRKARKGERRARGGAKPATRPARRK